MRRGKWLAVAFLAGLVAGMVGIALAAGSGSGHAGSHGAAGANAGTHGNSGSNGQGSEHGTHPHTPVLICHHTHSASNPVVAIVTDDDAVIAHHEQHGDDQIFTENVPAADDQAAQDAMCGIQASGAGSGQDPGGTAGAGEALPTPPPLTG
jgi:hypothetical protein